MNSLTTTIWGCGHSLSEEQEQALHEILKRLSSKQQEVLNLYYEQQLTMKKIALLQQCSVSTISKHLNTALFFLRQHLHPQSLEPMYRILYPETKRPVPLNEIFSSF
jgi:DNA-directed RNA polymerase specialized sigma24 family protein